MSMQQIQPLSSVMPFFLGWLVKQTNQSGLFHLVPANEMIPIEQLEQLVSDIGVDEQLH